jgi:hypothetical protein
MPSLFADQFNYSGPYGLDVLPTAAPSVSLRVPDPATPKGELPTGEAGEAAGAAGAAGAADAAASSEASQNAISSSGSATANSQSLANQGTLNKLTHMESSNANAVNAANPVPETNTYRSDGSMFDTPSGPTPSEHTAPAPSTANRPATSQNASQWTVQRQTTPSWGQDWNTLSNGYKSVVNGLSRAFPLPGGSSQNNVGRSSTDAGVTEPTNVWNPSENSSAYTNPSAVGSGAQNAIEMSPYSPQFKASFGLDYAKNGQAASEVANQPSSDDIWSGIENVVKNPGEIFSEL